MKESIHVWIMENKLSADMAEHRQRLVEYLPDRTQPMYGEALLDALALKQEFESGDNQAFEGAAETETKYGSMAEMVSDFRFFGPDHHSWWVWFLGNQERVILIGGGNLIWRPCEQKAQLAERLVRDPYGSISEDFFVIGWKFTVRKSWASDSILAVSDCLTQWDIDRRSSIKPALGGHDGDQY